MKNSDNFFAESLLYQIAASVGRRPARAADARQAIKQLVGRIGLGDSHYTFHTARAHDALYFILYVWKQLGFNHETDELHLVGAMPDEQWLAEHLHIYLQRVFVISPKADFGNLPAARIKNMPYDLMALYYKA